MCLLASLVLLFNFMRLFKFSCVWNLFSLQSRCSALLTSSEAWPIAVRLKADSRRNERLPVTFLIQILPTFNMSLNRPIIIVPDVKQTTLSKLSSSARSAFHFQYLL